MFPRQFIPTKAKFAARSGAAGLILYSDPADYAVPGGEVYPNGIFLPGTGTQRGTCMDGNGDPETPNYPSVGELKPTSGRIRAIFRMLKHFNTCI